MYEKIDKYINRLIEESRPDAPMWNIESIRQGSKPHWNYIDGCMLGALLVYDYCNVSNRQYYQG